MIVAYGEGVAGSVSNSIIKSCCIIIIKTTVFVSFALISIDLPKFFILIFAFHSVLCHVYSPITTHFLLHYLFHSLSDLQILSLSLFY